MNWYKKLATQLDAAPNVQNVPNAQRAAPPGLQHIQNVEHLIHNSIKPKLHALMNDRQVAQFFTDYALQHQFVNCDAAFTRVSDLVKQYQDVHSAIERLKMAWQIFRTIIGELSRRIGQMIVQHQYVTEIAQDAKNLMNILNQALNPAQ